MNNVMFRTMLLLITLSISSLITIAAESEHCSSEQCRKKIKDIRQYAFNGSPKAQLILGLAYRYGDGIEKNHQQAAKFIKKAAKNKMPAAIMHLSDLYSQGIGVSQDTHHAKSLLKKASDMNYAPAMFQLSMSTFDLATTTAESEEVLLLTKSASLDYEPAMYLLAKMYDSGTVIPQDLDAALALYEKLSVANYKDSTQLFDDKKQYSSTFAQQTDIEVITVVGVKWDVDMFLDDVLIEVKDEKSPFDRHPATGSHIRGTTCGLHNSRGCRTAREKDEMKNLGVWW